MNYFSGTLTLVSGWWGTRYQTFKPFPLTHYADISDLDSSLILGLARDKSRVSIDQSAILGGKRERKRAYAVTNCHKRVAFEYGSNWSCLWGRQKYDVATYSRTPLENGCFSSRKLHEEKWNDPRAKTASHKCWKRLAKGHRRAYLGIWVTAAPVLI